MTRSSPHIIVVIIFKLSSTPVRRPTLLLDVRAWAHDLGLSSVSWFTQYVRLIAGATLSAAHTLRDDQGNISICWDGGRHHAQKAQASGFCYVADCVLAILALKQSQESPHDSLHAEPRIMYLAFDLHFSDGGSQAFYSSGSTSSTPQVLTFSIHQTAPDPSDPSFDPFTLSIPLARGASNATFARIWPAVERVNQAFDRDYIAVQCGAGGLTGDPYAVWNWSLGVAEGSISGCIEQICLVRVVIIPIMLREPGHIQHQ